MRILNFVIALSVFTTLSAQAEVVSCKAKDAKGLTVKLDFDPTIAIPTIWKKDRDGRGYIEGIKLGKKNGAGLTTARVEMKIPRSEFKAPYSGTFEWSEYYEVNIEEKAGSGYSDRFGGKGYISFHGHDKDQLWDAMAYIPLQEVREENKTFPGLLTIQASIMDQGYYHIDLVCSSKP